MLFPEEVLDALWLHRKGTLGNQYRGQFTFAEKLEVMKWWVTQPKGGLVFMCSSNGNFPSLNDWG